MMTTAELPNRPPPNIYTTGWAGRDIADLKPMLTRLTAVLIDVRFTPAARRIEWSKTYLQLLLKEKYRHLPQLGSRTLRAGKPSIQNLDLGIKIICSIPTNLVLMCECAEPGDVSPVGDRGGTPAARMGGVGTRGLEKCRIVQFLMSVSDRITRNGCYSDEECGSHNLYL